jgi:ribosome maturation protein SDO1
MAHPGTQLVRMKKGKKHFEVATQPGSVLKFRAGSLGFEHVLAAELVFTNYAKGERASESDLQEAFASADQVVCARAIVEKGELQVSAAERKEALERKKREIIAYLNRNFIDPKSNLPHPASRIETAFEQAKFRVDADAPAKDQAAELAKKLQGVLTFKKSETEGTIVVPHKLMGAATNVIYKHATVRREKQTPEGYQWEVGIVPGDFDDFMEALNKVTKGDFQFHVANPVKSPEEEKAAAAAAAAAAQGGKKGKKGRGGAKEEAAPAAAAAAAAPADAEAAPAAEAAAGDEDANASKHERERQHKEKDKAKDQQRKKGQAGKEARRKSEDE